MGRSKRRLVGLDDKGGRENDGVLPAIPAPSKASASLTDLAFGSCASYPFDLAHHLSRRVTLLPKRDPVCPRFSPKPCTCMSTVSCKKCRAPTVHPLCHAFSARRRFQRTDTQKQHGSDTQEQRGSPPRVGFRAPDRDSGARVVSSSTFSRGPASCLLFAP